MSLFTRLAVNASFIYSTRIVEGLIQLAILPFILSHAGRECYGAALLLLSVQELVELARGGMQKATVKYLSEFMAKKDFEKASILFSGSEMLQGFVGFIGLLVSIFLAPYATYVFAIPAGMEFDAKCSMILLGIGIFISFVFSPWQNAVAANERYDLVSISRIGGKIVRALLILLFLRGTFSPLIVLVTSFIIGNLFERVICVWFVRRLKQYFHLHYSVAAMTAIRKLVSFSFFDFLHTLSGILYRQVPLYIAAHFISLSAVAGLGIIGNIASLLNVAMAQVGQMLVPTVSRLNAEGEDAKVKQLIMEGTNLLVFLGGIILAAILPWTKGILNVWLGSSYETLAFACIIMLWATYLLDSLTCLHNSLGGVGLVKVDGISNMLSTGIGLVIGFTLVRMFNLGLEGLVGGLFVARVLRFFFVSLYGSKVFEIPVEKLFWIGYLKSYILLFPLMFLPLVSELHISSLTELIAGSLLTALIYLCLGIWKIIEPGPKRKLFYLIAGKLQRQASG